MALFSNGQTQVSYELRNNAFMGDVLFIHGNIASNHWWYPTVEQLTQQRSESWTGRLVLAELRGCGESPAIPASTKLTVDDLVQDFLALTEGLNLKNVTLVGYSTGGLVALLMMSQRPDLFRGAVLIDPVGPKGITFPDEILEKYAQMTNDRDLTAMIIGATIHGNDASSAFFKDVIVEDTMKALKKCGTQVLLALRDKDVADRIKVAHPVLIFHGQHDWVLEEHHATDLQKLLPNSEFIKLADHGHCFNMENPKRFADYLVSFYQETGKTGRAKMVQVKSESAVATATL